MWLKLNLDGIIFHLRIRGYKKTSKQWDDEWSQDDFSVLSGEWLNYQVFNRELLLMVEIEQLQARVEDLLSDMVMDEEEMEFIEPDLKFTFSPKFNVSDDQNFVFATSGKEILDVFMELRIALWNEGCLTGNELLLVLNREEIESLLCYLHLVTGKIDRSDIKAQELISKGVIYGEI